MFAFAKWRRIWHRKAPGGLTAIELVALANRLESTDFPPGKVQLPAVAQPQP